MAEQQFEMTKKGYDEAKERLKYLQTVKRQEIVERIAAITFFCMAFLTSARSLK